MTAQPQVIRRGTQIVWFTHPMLWQIKINVPEKGEPLDLRTLVQLTEMYQPIFPAYARNGD